MTNKNLFDGQLERILEATGTKTQAELAQFLGRRQGTVSLAKKRGKIPADWLITIAQVKGIHLEWLLTGEGPCRITAPVPPGCYETADQVDERRAKDEALRNLSSKELTDELLRRIAVAQVDASIR